MFRKKVDAREATETCWLMIRERAKLALKRIYPNQFPAGRAMSDEDFFPIHANVDFIFLWIKVTNLLALDQSGVNENEELLTLILASDAYNALFFEQVVRQISLEGSPAKPGSYFLNLQRSPYENEQIFNDVARDIFEDSLSCDCEVSQYKEICRQICEVTVGKYYTPISAEPPITSDLLSSALTYSIFLRANRVDRKSYRRL